MRPTQHPSNNRVIGAPKGWNQNELPCNAIAVTDHDLYTDDMRNADGTLGMHGIATPAVSTYWQPSEQELALLNAGAKVQVTVPGKHVQPMMLRVALP